MFLPRNCVVLFYLALYFTAMAEKVDKQDSSVEDVSENERENLLSSEDSDQAG